MRGLCSCLQGGGAGGGLHLFGDHVCHFLLPPGHSFLSGTAAEEVSQLWSHFWLDGPNHSHVLQPVDHRLGSPFFSFSSKSMFYISMFKNANHVYKDSPIYNSKLLYGFSIIFSLKY